MRMSKMGFRSQKERGNKEIISQEIFFQAGLLKRYETGIYGLGNVLLVARNNIVEIIRNVMEKYDCTEVSLPSLQSKSLWTQSGRWKLFGETNQIFSFQGRDDEYCLGPSGEEIAVDFVKDNIISYMDLPINIFQIGPKYRDVIRARVGLIKGKEFLMKDGYSFHSTYEDMLQEYEKMKKAHLEVFTVLGLNVLPVQRFKPEYGGKSTEELMYISDLGQNKVLYDKEHNIALSKDILDDQQICKSIKKKYPYIAMEKLEEQSCLDVGDLSKLGQLYSKNLNIHFMNENGEKGLFYACCYGIGINRVLSAICQQNCDSEGLVWAKDIAPYNASVLFTEENQDNAFYIYHTLRKSGISAIIDDRKNSLGFKIKDSKLLGAPFLIIIGNKVPDGYAEVEIRKTGKRYCIHAGDLVRFIKEYKI